MTTAQALIAFLAAQQVERDGSTAPLFAGVLGIFGHGNVAGVGQALQQHGGLRYVLPRNEQAMVHTAVAYARHRNRLQTWACTSSIGPGATNMVTGAALATINRLPVLLLPGDVFASRRVNPALQQLEIPRRARRVGQRRVAAGQPLLRPHQPPRPAAGVAARGDAGADRPGRDRRGHPGAAPGRAGRGVRLSAGALRTTGVADRPARARRRRGAGGGRRSCAGRSGR